MEHILNVFSGREIGGFEMKLGWGKPVPIPPHPIYIPPALAELTQPPPPSGLPFNAQPKMSRRDSRGFNNMPMPKNRAEMEKVIVARSESFQLFLFMYHLNENFFPPKLLATSCLYIGMKKLVNFA